MREIVIFGSVDANRRPCYRAARALDSTNRGWLEGLVTRRVAMRNVARALEREPGDIEVVPEFAS